MFRNIRIGQITPILTLLLVGVNVIVFLLIYFWGTTYSFSISLFLVIIILSIIFIFLVVKLFLENIVLQKIKIIYKMIEETRSSRNIDNIEEMAITTVNNEVMEWARNRESEIEDLNKLEAYRRNYLGNISHELKTPIFSIQGYIHTLLDGGIYDETINIKYLRRAASNIERLQNIVEDLETINKLESGKVLLQMESFDLKELALEVIDDLVFQAEKEEIKIGLHPRANVSFRVLADREKIRQVLLNLVSNGIKYGKRYGKVQIGFYNLDEKVLVEIEDNGIGIKEQHLVHLFDRFYRVDDSRSRKLGGSGLGLSIVKHILEAHDQTISVKSQLGKGTILGFTLDKG